MGFLALNFIFILLLGSELSLIPKPLPFLTPQVVMRVDKENQSSKPFSDFLTAKRARGRSYDIKITPKVTKIRARDLNLMSGRTAVLSIPIEITNSSPDEISTNISHEWFGGIEPATDLFVAALYDNTDGKFWAEARGYQVGERGAVGRTVLQPRETKTFDVRLNWPGTGSCPATPLLDASQAGRYSIKFLLFFKVYNSEEYVETQDFDLAVDE